METISEEMRFRTGEDLWDWILHSNPIAGAILAGLELSEEQTATVRAALGDLVRERAGGDGPAVLTAPVNIGIGTAC